MLRSPITGNLTFLSVGTYEACRLRNGLTYKLKLTIRFLVISLKRQHASARLPGFESLSSFASHVTLGKLTFLCPIPFSSFLIYKMGIMTVVIDKSCCDDE